MQNGLGPDGRIAPTTVQVHCEQHLHAITFDGHRLHFVRHEQTSLAFLAALHTNSRCAEIWRLVRERRALGPYPGSWSHRIPPELRRALILRLFHKVQQHHGEHLTPAAAWEAAYATLHVKVLRKRHRLFLQQLKAQGIQVHLTADPAAPHTAGALLIPGGKIKSRWGNTREAVARYQDKRWTVNPPAIHAGLNRVRRFADYTHPSWIEWETANGRLAPKSSSWKFRTRPSAIAEITRRLTTLADEVNCLRTLPEQAHHVTATALVLETSPPPPDSLRRSIRLVSLRKSPTLAPLPLEQLPLFPA
jgi:hypothetical protein